MTVSGRRGTGFGFVGRGSELRTLLDAVRTGPAVVFIEGEPGIGKSRLVGEAALRLQGDKILVLRGSCLPLREPLPFEPVIEALRDGATRISPDMQLSPAVTILVRYLPELVERLPGPANDETVGPVVGGVQHRMMRAVHEVVTAIGPLVLVVEDVHWADEATRELLLLLASNPPQEMRLVITYRAQDLSAGTGVLGPPYRRPVGVGGADIRLRPLNEPQVRELAVSSLGRSAGSALGQQLYDRSGGLPLAVEEDLLALCDHLEHPNADAMTALKDVGIPRSVEESVKGRVRGLNTEAMAVVQAAAVLAVPASEELLAALARLDEDETEAGLTAALEASVLEETSTGQYGFRHVLARQAVYEGILGPARRRLHRRAAELLTARVPPALVQIAYHTRQQGDVQAWIPRAQAAAEHAVEIGDDGITTELLQQLLAEPSLPPDLRNHFALALARIAASRIDSSATVSVLRRIVTDPGLPATTRGEVRLGLASALGSHTMGPEVEREMERAVDELADRPELAAVAMARRGMGTSATPIAQEIAWMDRALNAVARTSDLVVEATVLASRITLLETLGDPSARELLIQLSQMDGDRAVQQQIARGLHNAADQAFWHGDDMRARSLLDEAEVVACRTHSQHWEHSCRVIRMNLDFASGNWSGLDQRLDAFALQAKSDESYFSVESLLVRALLEIARGQWGQARERLDALAEFTHQAYPPWEMVRAAAIGRLDLAEGRTKSAWNALQPALDLLRHKGVWGWTTDLIPTAVQAALACDNPDEAHRLIEQVTRGIDGAEAPGVAAELQWARGLVLAPADPHTALEYLEQARTRLQALGRVHRAALITEHVGSTMSTDDPHNPGRAARYFHEATDTYRKLGATADEARCSQTLREIGQQRPVPRGRHSYGDELSPREQQVANLLATGATNQSIAQALSLSVRTVEHHVAKTLKKLHATRSSIRASL
ncbi:AAA family ATPase [Streptomyces sp. HNM0663]|uniref:AAA family ATPase n=1 Tax=Streptomyces chengmaiensis TaxID=3040919 RepID=A0ABT6HXG6_9ACTN|nr:AAA family ATPase [Streptomyces chengmaiensis]MDH2393290.1 AAA family ATPase [Streptomyces chengmaiensis]